MGPPVVVTLDQSHAEVQVGIMKITFLTEPPRPYLAHWQSRLVELKQKLETMQKELMEKDLSEEAYDAGPTQSLLNEFHNLYAKAKNICQVAEEKNDEKE